MAAGGSIAQATDAELLAAGLSPNYSPFFAAGMVVYLIHSRGHSVLRWLVLGYAVCLTAYQGVVHFVVTAMSENTGLSPVVGAFVILVLIGLVMLVTLTLLVHVGPCWLVFAGALTYPVYLLHENWSWWMIGWLHPMLGRWPTVLVVTSVR